ncbi:hypothetical protein LTR62_005955 [Meristemomyces frigidus]|uniref:Tautomerase cis-CaaD-like domain-containing protein n=1 Tax=Meristemomyces frigidus TaxID=1508187 RepID=A0AAN7YS36_9PEZI|nr:hypothetical protein LTR62_005955 [Meristemomyces frigidus]
MPFYEIRHICPLTLPQKDSLALAITNAHSTLFTTPAFFVNVAYTDTSTQDLYVAGKPQPGNHIRAHIRTGPSRTRKEYAELCARVHRAWEEIVSPGLPSLRRGEEVKDTKLRSCILLGDLVYGTEAGFAFPQAGGDKQWLEENWEEFERRAGEGDEEMRGLVEEVKERGLVGPGDGMTAQQRLEEALGWGDAA